MDSVLSVIILQQVKNVCRNKKIIIIIIKYEKLKIILSDVGDLSYLWTYHGNSKNNKPVTGQYWLYYYLQHQLTDLFTIRLFFMHYSA